MASKRIARLNEQVRRELTYLLQRDVRDPRIGVVTVTGVEISPDLYHAKVFYSVMGSDEDRDSAAEGLRAAAGFLRTEIAKRMHTRRAPELHFTHDNTLQHAMHIERLLQEARASRAQDDHSPGDMADATGEAAAPTGEAADATGDTAIGPEDTADATGGTGRGSDVVGEDEHGRD